MIDDFDSFRSQVNCGDEVTLTLSGGQSISGRVDSLSDAGLVLRGPKDEVTAIKATAFATIVMIWQRSGPAKPAARTPSIPESIPRPAVPDRLSIPPHATPPVGLPVHGGDNDVLLCPPQPTTNTMEKRSTASPPQRTDLVAVAPPLPAESLTEDLIRLAALEARYDETVKRESLRPRPLIEEFPAEQFPQGSRTNAQKLWVQAWERYRYALKVNEVGSRVYVILASLRTLQERHPSVGPLSYNIGCLLLMRSHASEALRYFEAAFVAQPTPDVLYNAAVAAVQAKNRPAAVDWLSQFCVLEPRNPAWFVLLRLVDELGAGDIWEEMLGRVVEGAGSPDVWPLTLEALAYRLKKRGRDQEACAALRLSRQAPDVHRLVAAYRELCSAEEETQGATDEWRAFQQKREQARAERVRQQEQIAYEERRRERRTTTMVGERKAEDVIRSAKELMQQGLHSQAIGLLEAVCRELPDEEEVQHLLESCIERVQSARASTSRVSTARGKKPSGGQGVPQGEGPYARAKRAQLLDKNLDRAESLFLEAINKGDNTESAIKDLTSLLQQVGRHGEAAELVKQNQHRIANKKWVQDVSWFSFRRAGKYDAAIAILEQMRRARPSQRTSIDRRIAICYSEKGDQATAERLVRRLLQENPTDVLAREYLEKIRQAKTTGEPIAPEPLSELMYGVSPFIKHHLKGCQFEGLRKEDRVSRNFSLETVEYLQRFIEGQGNARPQERAKYLLTAARLLEEIGSEDHVGFGKYLRQFCAAKGDAVALEGRPMDVVRSFYTEAFYIEPIWGNQLAIKATQFMLSFVCSQQELQAANFPSLEGTIDLLFQNGDPPKDFWNGILNLVATSQHAVNHLLPLFWERPRARESALEFLAVNKNSVSWREEFLKHWEQARARRVQEHDNCLQDFHTLARRCRITTADLEGMRVVLLRHAGKPWLLSLDQDRLARLLDLVSILDQFCRQPTFEERERQLDGADIRIGTLLNEVGENPTRFALAAIHPFLEELREKVRLARETLLEGAEPKITLSLDIESVSPDADRVLPLHVRITNQTGSSPITNTELVIVPRPGLYSPLEASYATTESIRGGDSRLVPCALRLTPEAVADRAVSVEVKVAYENRRNARIRLDATALSVKLYDRSEFVPIPNPFNPGPPVRDRSMFVGRDEVLDTIANALAGDQGKCFVLYGQKRSGKSSVMHHLRERLNDSGRFLCAHFSLGDVGVNSFSELAFQHRFLTALDETLDDLRHKGQQTPPFKVPRKSELEAEGPTFFRDLISGFQRECRRTPGWKERRLVVTIDEFTYFYTRLCREERGGGDGEGRSPSATFLQTWKAFMQTWKALLEGQLFSAVLVGQDVMPEFMRKFPNEFGLPQDWRLTYLSEPSTRELIEDPIRIGGRGGESRFRKGAIERVRELTAGNPFYIQMLGERLVRHMNVTYSTLATEADILRVASDMIKGENALDLKGFDGLIAAGETDLESIQVKDRMAALHAVAEGSAMGGSCPRSLITPQTHTPIDEILHDMESREVLEMTQEGHYRIRVGLFRDWLLAHPSLEDAGQ